jgi:hypothetical protein
LLLWGVLCRQVRFSALPGEGVGLVLLPQILGMARVWVLSLEADLVLQFPLNLDLGLTLGTGPFLCLSIPWWRLAAGLALPAA